VITTGDGPSARFSVAGDCLDPVKGGVLVFIGGCNKSLEALDDMYYLYTGLSYLYIYLRAIFPPPASSNIWFWELIYQRKRFLKLMTRMWNFKACH
jgi:hypothetical protein